MATSKEKNDKKNTFTAEDFFKNDSKAENFMDLYQSKFGYVPPEETDFSRGLSGNAREAFGYPRYVPPKDFITEAMEKAGLKVENNSKKKEMNKEEQLRFLNEWVKEEEKKTQRLREMREEMNERKKKQNPKGGKKRRTIRRKSKKSKRYSIKMMGGALNEQVLMQKGFNAEQIAALRNYGIDNMDLINISLQQTNPQTGAQFTPQELIDSLNDAMNEVANLDNEDNVVEGVNPPAEMNIPEPLNVNANNNFQPGPALAMEDLQPESPRSVVDFPQGGRRQKMSSRMHSRSKKAIKKRGRSRIRKTYKGGACYGNGVGANAYDPNYSIFNTRELQLFPYKPY